MNRRYFLKMGMSLTLAGGLTLSSSAQQGLTKSMLTPEEVAEVLSLHNEARLQVGNKPLLWSDELASHAQDWANHLAQSGEFNHSRSRYGENIADAPTVLHAIVLWLVEAEDHGFNHYTQMVWGSTKRIGCGKSKVGDNYIWVCNYDPPGNVRGRKPF